MADILTGPDVVSEAFRSANTTGSGRLVVEGRGSVRGVNQAGGTGGVRRGVTQGGIRRLLGRGRRSEHRRPDLLDLLGEGVAHDPPRIVAARVEGLPVDVA